MAKKNFLLSLLTIFLLIQSLFVPASLAQTDQTNAQSDKFTTCLKNRVDPATGKPIPDAFSLTWHDPPSPSSLKKYLTGTFHPNSPVYAIACIGTGDGRTCSTGNKANDDYLFFSDLGIENSTGQQVKINQNVNQNTDLTQIIPVRFYLPGTTTEGSKQLANGQGVVNYDTIVYGTQASTGAYSFYGVEIRQRNNVNYGVFEEAGQKQGTFEFDFPDTSGSDCAKISWTHHDPYGVVFDAKSLEPLSGVTITILDKDGKKVQFPGFVNDIKTGIDGTFNYSVQEGVYSLMITPPSNYKFESDPPLNPNAERIYVYKDTNGSFCSLYKPGDQIAELIDTAEEQIKKAPNPECRNIALTPLGQPYVADKVVSMFYDLNKNDLVYTFDGKVSHPLTLVSVEQDGNQLGSQRANNSGYYTVSVPVSAVSPTSPLEVVFTKADLTGSLVQLLKRFLHIEVNAATTSKIVVNPIFSYVEGYAYDSQNHIIPNADVKLRLKRTDGVYFETQADQKGYFLIPPSNIPAMEYEIEFVSPLTGKSYLYQTYQFAKLNETYLKTNQINLITATKAGQKITPEQKTEGTASNSASPVFQQNEKLNNNNNNTNNNPAVAKTAQKTPFNFSIVITIFILVVLILAAVGLVIFLKARNRQTL